jgi:hypothetical protein
MRKPEVVVIETSLNAGGVLKKGGEGLVEETAEPPPTPGLRREGSRGDEKGISYQFEPPPTPGLRREGSRGDEKGISYQSINKSLAIIGSACHLRSCRSV